MRVVESRRETGERVDARDDHGVRESRRARNNRAETQAGVDESVVGFGDFGLLSAHIDLRVEVLFATKQLWKEEETHGREGRTGGDETLTVSPLLDVLCREAASASKIKDVEQIRQRTGGCFCEASGVTEGEDDRVTAVLRHLAHDLEGTGSIQFF
jgi:hypothetical protein